MQEPPSCRSRPAPTPAPADSPRPSARSDQVEAPGAGGTSESSTWLRQRRSAWPIAPRAARVPDPRDPASLDPTGRPVVPDVADPEPDDRPRRARRAVRAAESAVIGGLACPHQVARDHVTARRGGDGHVGIAVQLGSNVDGEPRAIIDPRPAAPTGNLIECRQLGHAGPPSVRPSSSPSEIVRLATEPAPTQPTSIAGGTHQQI